MAKNLLPLPLFPRLPLHPFGFAIRMRHGNSDLRSLMHLLNAPLQNCFLLRIQRRPVHLRSRGTWTSWSTPMTPARPRSGHAVWQRRLINWLNDHQTALNGLLLLGLFYLTL